MAEEQQTIVQNKDNDYTTCQSQQYQNSLIKNAKPKLFEVEFLNFTVKQQEERIKKLYNEEQNKKIMIKRQKSAKGKIQEKIRKIKPINYQNEFNEKDDQFQVCLQQVKHQQEEQNKKIRNKSNINNQELYQSQNILKSKQQSKVNQNQQLIAKIHDINSNPKLTEKQKQVKLILLLQKKEEKQLRFQSLMDRQLNKINNKKCPNKEDQFENKMKIFKNLGTYLETKNFIQQLGQNEQQQLQAQPSKTLDSQDKLIEQKTVQNQDKITQNKDFLKNETIQDMNILSKAQLYLRENGPIYNKSSIQKAEDILNYLEKKQYGNSVYSLNACLNEENEMFYKNLENDLRQGIINRRHQERINYSQDQNFIDQGQQGMLEKQNSNRNINNVVLQNKNPNNEKQFDKPENISEFQQRIKKVLRLVNKTTKQLFNQKFNDGIEVNEIQNSIQKLDQLNNLKQHGLENSKSNSQSQLTLSYQQPNNFVQNPLKVQSNKPLNFSQTDTFLTGDQIQDSNKKLEAIQVKDKQGSKIDFSKPIQSNKRANIIKQKQSRLKDVKFLSNDQSPQNNLSKHEQNILNFQTSISNRSSQVLQNIGIQKGMSLSQIYEQIIKSNDKGRIDIQQLKKIQEENKREQNIFICQKEKIRGQLQQEQSFLIKKANSQKLLQKQNNRSNNLSQIISKQNLHLPKIHQNRNSYKSVDNQNIIINQNQIEKINQQINYKENTQIQDYKYKKINKSMSKNFMYKQQNRDSQVTQQIKQNKKMQNTIDNNYNSLMQSQNYKAQIILEQLYFEDNTSQNEREIIQKQIDDQKKQYQYMSEKINPTEEKLQSLRYMLNPQNQQQVQNASQMRRNLKSIKLVI